MNFKEVSKEAARRPWNSRIAKQSLIELLAAAQIFSIIISKISNVQSLYQATNKTALLLLPYSGFSQAFNSLDRIFKRRENVLSEKQSFNLDSGSLFAERYRILKPLGSGGMGEVYLVEDTLLNSTQVALKIVHPHLLKDPRHMQRFLREVQLTRQVTHANIIRTFDAANYKETYFFTMEYFPCYSLKEVLEDKGKLSTQEVLPIFLDLCHGLAAIHAAGIIHRDLKPANILLCSDGVARIADFGIARPGESDLTGQNEVVGSSPYLAPEAWTGVGVSFRTDIYALGILMYEALSGELPFDANSPAEFMFKHLETAPRSLNQLVPTIPSWLERLILQMLSKDQLTRPENMLVVASTITSQLESGTYTRSAEVDQLDLVAEMTGMEEYPEEIEELQPTVDSKAVVDTVRFGHGSSISKIIISAVCLAALMYGINLGVDQAWGFLSWLAGDVPFLGVPMALLALCWPALLLSSPFVLLRLLSNNLFIAREVWFSCFLRIFWLMFGLSLLFAARTVRYSTPADVINNIIDGLTLGLMTTSRASLTTILECLLLSPVTTFSSAVAGGAGLKGSETASIFSLGFIPLLACYLCIADYALTTCLRLFQPVEEKRRTLKILLALLLLFILVGDTLLRQLQPTLFINKLNIFIAPVEIYLPRYCLVAGALKWLLLLVFSSRFCRYHNK